MLILSTISVVLIRYSVQCTTLCCVILYIFKTYTHPATSRNGQDTLYNTLLHYTLYYQNIYTLQHLVMVSILCTTLCCLILYIFKTYTHPAKSRNGQDTLCNTLLPYTLYSKHMHTPQHFVMVRILCTTLCCLILYIFKTYAHPAISRNGQDTLYNTLLRYTLYIQNIYTPRNI